MNRQTAQQHVLAARENAEKAEARNDGAEVYFGLMAVYHATMALVALQIGE